MRSSPAAERNKEPIFMALSPFLPEQAKVLEIASGTGQHAAFIASARPDILWQPSDRDEESLRSIREWGETIVTKNVLAPLELDILQPSQRDKLPQDAYDAVVSINMIHIAPWSAFLSLLDLAQKCLKKGGTLFLYGPFLVDESDTSPSNLAFDLSLKERNPEWGLRDLKEVIAEAERMGFKCLHRINMPANNLSVIFKNEKLSHENNLSVEHLAIFA